MQRVFSLTPASLLVSDSLDKVGQVPTRGSAFLESCLVSSSMNNMIVTLFYSIEYSLLNYFREMRPNDYRAYIRELNCIGSFLFDSGRSLPFLKYSGNSPLFILSVNSLKIFDRNISFFITTVQSIPSSTTALSKLHYSAAALISSKVNGSSGITHSSYSCEGYSV